MKIIRIVIGIHLLIMISYFIVIGSMSKEQLFQLMYIFPCHIGVCLLTAFVYFMVDAMSSIEESKWTMYAKAHLLSALAIAILGPSTCTFTFILRFN